jgi:tRNA(His) 5'-end guanylyltransferase
MRLDGREIAENTLFSIFLESKDEELLTLMQESFTKTLKQEGRFKNYGIDYLSDIILFEVPYDNYKIQGILVNISNTRLFTKNLTDLNVAFALKDDVGVILS